MRTAPRHLAAAAARCILALLLIPCCAGHARAQSAAPASATSSPGVPAFVVDGGTQVRIKGTTYLTLDCDLRDQGAFAPGPGSVLVLNGYGTPLLSGTSSFASLTLALHGTAALANAANVNGTLTLVSGWLSLAGHDLDPVAVVGGSPASYVITPDTLGRLVRSVGGSASVQFPVGNAAYDPVSVRTGAGTDLFRVAVLDAPPVAGLVPSTALPRAWAIAHANAPGVNGLLTYSVQWNSNEVPASFDRGLSAPYGAWAWRWLGGAWVPQSGVRRTDNFSYPAVDTLVTPDAGLWTLAGTSQLLAADPPEPAAPRTLELAAAFPNPARGTTTLRYGLPHRAHVTLALYTVLGERAATLADGEQLPGWHVVRFDDPKLPSGIYFLRLQAGAESRSSKLVRMR